MRLRAAILVMGIAGGISGLRAAEDGYVAAGACQGCHPQIYRTYLQTGMGRSFGKLESAAPVENWDQKNTFYHAASDRYYAVFRRGGKHYLRRHQIGYGGTEANIVEKQIDYVIGSGNHARSYVHRTKDGRLLELPLSWYAAEGGYWAMSPGFDRPDHPDFRREISQNCLFCHNGYPAVAGGGMAEGIDCQRCHGPGREHVNTAAAGGQPDAIRASIVNPARLGAERQMEVCMQCHLQTTSRPLPHALRRYDRTVFSYRPGEPLGDYMIHFDHARGGPYNEKFEVNGGAYRFRKSQCYLQSKGRMTCTTCHDPHHVLRGEAAQNHYQQVCLSCHSIRLAKFGPGEHPSGAQGCTGCHMPRRRTEDAIHVVMTDHRIQRQRPAGDLLAPRKEIQNIQESAYSGDVELYYPPDLLDTPENRLYLALAQVKDLVNLKGGIPRLEKAIAGRQPTQAEFYFDLAEAYRKSGQHDRAIEFYTQAIRRKRDFIKAHNYLGEVLLRKGETHQAIALLENALKAAPRDTDLLTTLAVAYGQTGKVKDSVRLLTVAVEINPDLPLAWLNLGVSLEQEGRNGAAATAYRNAIRRQPDFARAHNHLANLLASQGDLRQAAYHYRKALEGSDQAAREAARSALEKMPPAR